MWINITFFQLCIFLFLIVVLIILVILITRHYYLNTDNDDGNQLCESNTEELDNNEVNEVNESNTNEEESESNINTDKKCVEDIEDIKDIEDNRLILCDDNICTVEDTGIIIECNIPKEFHGTGKVNTNSKIYKRAREAWLAKGKPKFSETIPEIICHQHMLENYNIDMKTGVRPKFLKNPETKRNLEYDLYDSDLKLAIEYQGITHAEWPNYSGQTKKQFKEQLRRDDLKLRLSDLNGVYLISVPHVVDYDSIPSFLDYYLKDFKF